MPNLQRKQAIVQPTLNSPTNKQFSGKFVQVPVELLREDNLSPAALKLYLNLLAYCGPKAIAWPSQERLAQDMHLSERRVRGLMVELTEAGLVEVKHCTGSSNTYLVHKYSLAEGEHSESETTPFKPMAEENFRVERKKISAHVHELESKNLCEAKVDTTRNSLTGINPDDRASNQDELNYLVDLFVSGGMSVAMGSELACVVHKNNRRVSYVKLLIEASRNPEVHNPIGFIRFMVLRNAEPTGSSKSGKHHTQPRLKISTNQPLDFAKYTSGKYAHLSRNQPLAFDLYPAKSLELNSEPDIVQQSVALDEIFVEVMTTWLGVRRRLVASKAIAENVSQHGRIRPGSRPEEYRLEFPKWLNLSNTQQVLLQQELQRSFRSDLRLEICLV